MSNRKILIQRLYDEAWSNGKFDIVNNLISDSCLYHLPVLEPDFGMGAESLIKTITMYRNSFPDLDFDVMQMIEEGNIISVLWNATGTNKGNLGDIPATKRKGEVRGVHLFRFEGSQVVESWITWDNLGLLHQLGVLPAK